MSSGTSKIGVSGISGTMGVSWTSGVHGVLALGVNFMTKTLLGVISGVVGVTWLTGVAGVLGISTAGLLGGGDSSDEDD